MELLEGKASHSLTCSPGSLSDGLYQLLWLPGLFQLCPEELDQTHPLGLELKLNQVAIPA